MSFTHLHVHTDYSVDGTARIRQLFCEAKIMGMPGLAITDHGTLAGVPTFLREAEHYPSVKPIVGCEFYLENGSRLYHLILLAKNLSGYQNLLKLCSSAHKVKNDDRPRITRENVAKFHENLICTSACIGGEIPQAIIEGNYDKAKSITTWYKNVFGEDFYLEVALHKGGKKIKLSSLDNQEAYLRSNKELVAKQKKAAEGIFRLGEELSIKVIVTNDVHFVYKEDAISHDACLCRVHRKRIGNPNRIRYSHLEYLKSEKEMSTLFPDYPEVISNTQDVLNKVETFSFTKNLSIPHLYDNPDEVLATMVNFGAETRFGTELPAAVSERLTKELDIISSTGNSAYFILIKYIVDNIRYGLKIDVGPGRGASTSSLVNYCLGITEINPLEYGLLFERFLWPGRISLPLIDIDVEDKRREEIISFLQERFGKDKIALVASYWSLGGLGGWDIVAKTYGIPDKTRKKIRSIKGQLLWVGNDDMDLRKKLDEAYQNGDSVLKEAMEQSLLLKNTILRRNILSYEVVISGDSIINHLPVEVVNGDPEGERTFMSQYTKECAEDCGVIPMTIMGLRILDVIKQTVDIINCRYPFDVDIKSIPLNDEKTMEVFVTGDTSDIFMFQSENLRKLLKEFRPDTFSDLVLLNAIYRPGPMDEIPQYLARKRGEEIVTYEMQELEPILAETYGIPAYQEQLMMIGKHMGLSDADVLKFRKLVGMRNLTYEDMRDKFIEGGINLGHSKEAMEALYERLFEDGCWAFNKSHSVSYTLIAWRCAWLKAHFPEEYVQTYNKVFPD